MSLSELPFGEITEASLLRLKDSKVPEGNDYEYKVAVGGADGDKKEFLKDVTSFANADGGHIIIGMEEDGGLPTALVGLSGDIDAEINRLENILRDAVQPRMVGYQIRRVSISGDRWAIVIRVPPSQIGPHRVSFQNSNRYYRRNSGGGHEASVDELRAMFMRSISNRERVEEFCKNRVMLIEAWEAPVAIQRLGGHAIVHLVPMVPRGEAAIDLARAKQMHDLAPLWGGQHNENYNLYGVIKTRRVAANGYLLIFRSGELEAVSTGLAQANAEGSAYVDAQALALEIIGRVERYVTCLAELGIRPPIAVSICLTGTKNCLFAVDDSEPQFVRQDNLWLPLSVIHEEGPRSATRAALKPALDALWNAAGAKDCSLYD